MLDVRGGRREDHHLVPETELQQLALQTSSDKREVSDPLECLYVVVNMTHGSGPRAERQRLLRRHSSLQNASSPPTVNEIWLQSVIFLNL